MANFVPNVGEWQRKQIEDIAALNPESLPESTPSDYVFSYVDLSCVKRGQITLPTSSICFAEAPSRARRIFRRGDILMSVVRPNLEGFSYIGFEPSDMICSTGFAVIRPSGEVCGEYLYQCLYSENISRQIARRLVGSGYPAINSTDVGRLEITFPTDKGEQLRIIRVLEAWDSRIERLEVLSAAKSKYIRGVLAECVGDARGDLKTGDWQMTTIGDVVNIQARRVEWDEHAIYRLLTVKRGCSGLSLRGDKIGEDILTKDLYVVKAGDFVISKRQVVHGAWAMATNEFEGTHVSKEYTCFTAKPDRLWMPYFDWLSKTARLQHEAFICSYGVDIEKMVLNVDWFLKTPILLPRLIETQKRMAALLDSLQREVDILGTEIELLRRQKRGLLRRLLRGGAVDPASEYVANVNAYASHVEPTA